ncbi:MAG: hypothetical protein Q7U39_06395 [Nitrospira sp.]|nr:hypothetical protein [Nitrospira sp.]
MSVLTIDQCHAALDALLLRYSKLLLSDANEAETRLKVIDKVLKEVLGWHEEDLTVEERCSEDSKTVFADYIVRTATTSLIVEAKKLGRHSPYQRIKNLENWVAFSEKGKLERQFVKFVITAV